MLRKHSINAAKKISRGLEQAKLTLESNRETIFDEAVRLTNSHLLPKGALEDSSELLEGVTQNPIGSIGDHELAVQEITQELLEGINSNIFYLKDVALPFINSVTMRLLDNIKGINPSDYQVVMVDEPLFMKNDTVRSYLSQYTNNVSTGTRITKVEAKTGDEIIADIRTGDPLIDDEITNAVARLGMGRVEDIFLSLFGSETTTYLNKVVNKNSVDLDYFCTRLLIQQEDKWVSNNFPVEYADVPFIAFFILQTYLDKPLAGTGIGLELYSNVVANMVRSFGYTCNKILNVFNSIISTGKVIYKVDAIKTLQVNESNNIIYVYKETYTKALTSIEGMCPEVITGMFLTDNILLTVEQIKGKIPYFLKVYADFVETQTKMIRQNITNRLVGAFPNALTEVIKDMTPEALFPNGFNHTEEITTVMQTLRNYFKTEIEKQDVEEINIQPIVERVLVHNLFTFNDVGAIYDIMVDVKNNTDDLNIKEILYWTNIIYLAKWVAGNFDVRSSELLGKSSHW